jgi:hypothetical protein
MWTRAHSAKKYKKNAPTVDTFAVSVGAALVTCAAAVAAYEAYKGRVVAKVHIVMRPLDPEQDNASDVTTVVRIRNRPRRVLVDRAIPPIEKKTDRQNEKWSLEFRKRGWTAFSSFVNQFSSWKIAKNGMVEVGLRDGIDIRDLKPPSQESIDLLREMAKDLEGNDRKGMQEIIDTLQDAKTTGKTGVFSKNAKSLLLKATPIAVNLFGVFAALFLTSGNGGPNYLELIV